MYRYLTEKEALEHWGEKEPGKELTVQNAVVEQVEVGFDTHFNAVVFQMTLKLEIGCICAFGSYDQRLTLGLFIEDILKFLARGEGEFTEIKALEGKPLRVLIEGHNGPVRGIGSYLEDEFFLFHEYFREKVKDASIFAHEILKK